MVVALDFPYTSIVKLPDTLVTTTPADPEILKHAAVPPRLATLYAATDGCSAETGPAIFSLAELLTTPYKPEAAGDRGMLAIGLDGGGRVIVLDPDGAVASVDAGDPSWSQRQPIARDLLHWVQDGMPLPPTEPTGVPDLGDVWLTRAVTGRDLLHVKRELGLAMSVAELRRRSHSVPCLLETGVPWGKYRVRTQSLNAVVDCVELRARGAARDD